MRSSPRQLTHRESEVLRLLIDGRTNRDIANSLGISAGTVKVYVQQILFKLGVADRTQAAIKAIMLGITELPS